MLPVITNTVFFLRKNLYIYKKKIYNVSLEPISLSSCSIGINKKISRPSTALLRNTNCWEDYIIMFTWSYCSLLDSLMPLIKKNNCYITIPQANLRFSCDYLYVDAFTVRLIWKPMKCVVLGYVNNTIQSWNDYTNSFLVHTTEPEIKKRGNTHCQMIFKYKRYQVQ